MREKAQRRQSTGTQEKEPRKEEEEERLTKRVMGLICKAHVSTGDRGLTSDVVCPTAPGPSGDDHTTLQVSASGRELPSTVQRGRNGSSHLGIHRQTEAC